MLLFLSQFNIFCCYFFLIKRCFIYSCLSLWTMRHQSCAITAFRSVTLRLAFVNARMRSMWTSPKGEPVLLGILEASVIRNKVKTPHITPVSCCLTCIKLQTKRPARWFVIDVFESGGFFPPWGVSSLLTEAPLKCIMSAPPLAQWKSGSQRGLKMRVQRTWQNGLSERVSGALPTAGSDSDSYFKSWQKGGREAHVSETGQNLNVMCSNEKVA